MAKEKKEEKKEKRRTKREKVTSQVNVLLISLLIGVGDHFQGMLPFFVMGVLSLVVLIIVLEPLNMINNHNYTFILYSCCNVVNNIIVEK